jgi:hypothetical protein
LGGEILTDTAWFTQTMVIGAWRKFQTFLSQLGHSRNKARIVLFGCPPFAATDPSQQQALTWTYFFDGVSFWAPPSAPVLPADCILPLKIWERKSAVQFGGPGWSGLWSSTATYQAGNGVAYLGQAYTAIASNTNVPPNSNAGVWALLNAGASGPNAMPFPEEPMTQALDGLPNRPYPSQAWNGCWEWRDDGVYLPGSQWTMDFQIEYAKFLPDPATVNGIPWYSTQTPYQYNQLVPIMRCLSPLSLYLAAELGMGRDDIDVPTTLQQAEDETKQLFNVEARQKQRATCSRRGFSSQIRPNRSGYGYGA